MKSIELIIIAFSVILHTAAAEKATQEGPVVKVEVTCKYVNLYTSKSDTSATVQRKVFPKGSVLSISGYDKDVEPKAIFVTINQTPEKLYEEPIKLIAKGRHTVKIRALDKDDNETILSLTYLIVE